MEYLIVKWLHILDAALRHWMGSAYYMFFTSLTKDVRAIASVVRFVVIADWAFTTPTIILQPLTGLYLIHLMGYPLGERVDQMVDRVVFRCWRRVAARRVDANEDARLG